MGRHVDEKTAVRLAILNQTKIKSYTYMQQTITLFLQLYEVLYGREIGNG